MSVERHLKSLYYHAGSSHTCPAAIALKPLSAA
jgi:hypothetical protein